MKSWSQPTAEQLDRVAVLSGRPENRAYFFDRLENPNWITPLKDRGAFADPPVPVPASEPGYVQFPPWPEGRYLGRMAAVDPEAVASVLMSIDVCDNPAVTRLVLEATATLADDQLRGLSTKVNQWLAAPFADYFADEGSSVVNRLFEAGETVAALSALGVLLEVQPDPRLAEKAAAGDSPLRPRLEAVARFRQWQYERVLRQVLGAAVDAAGLDAVQLLASLLDDALRLSRWNDDMPAYDSNSHIWRPAIENHAQNAGRGIKHVLVSAVRDAALRFAARGQSALEAAIRDLETRSTIHRRVALHVLASSAHGAALVSERLANRSLFDDRQVRHEYAALLRARFQEAEPSVQREVLSWIERGPDVDAYRRRRANVGGPAPDETEVSHYADIWRRDRYSFVKDHLKGNDAERYGDLVRAHGEPEHPDFVTWMSTGWGSQSPASRDDLVRQSPDEVLEYLRSWRPDADAELRFGPSIEGLGQTFNEVVKARADVYAPVGERLVGLDPTYVRAYFSGLEDALREGVSLSWDQTLSLASHAASQPFEADYDVPDTDRDPDWRWCRREIASLLRSGVGDKENRIPFEYRERVWAVIERLTNDPNPTAAHEARYGGENMDPLTLSLNTNRGTAMHAVVEYALWCRRELESEGADVSVGFDLMPEVRDVLEVHLNVDEEISLMIRAVYGRWLPWLLLLDERWTIAHESLIFPTGSEEELLAHTAWETYVTSCPPFDSSLRALREQYEAAVERVPGSKRAGSFGDETIDSKLGEHLITFYWRGILEDELLEKYLNRAGDENTSQVVEFVGRSLHETEGDVPAPILARMKSLCEKRLAAGEANPTAHIRELRAFGFWFASGKFEEDWSLEVLERSVQLAGAPTLSDLVVERLAAVVNRRPTAAARILAMMLKGSENDWDYIGWRDEAQAIVQVAFSGGDTEAAENCAVIIDFYVRHGELGFRDLLPDPGS